MRVLVTGAAGFVGRWLMPALATEGAELHGVALDAPPPIAPGVPPQPPVRWTFGDLREDGVGRRAMESARPDVVIHLAAVSHVPSAAADPAFAWDVNVTATARLLHQVERLRQTAGIDPLVLMVGSAEQYGRQPGEARPLAEETPQAPRTVYAATKCAQEVLALQHWRASGLRVVVARSFNHSGPGQSTRFLLPALVERIRRLAEAPPGTPLPVGNRSPIRDFLHVSDVVAAYISLCRHGVPGEAYNVASGTGWSVQALLDRALTRAGVQAVPTEDPALVRPVDVPALVGDPRKLQQATGWRVTRALDDIIDDLLHAATL